MPTPSFATSQIVLKKPLSGQWDEITAPGAVGGQTIDQESAQ